MARQRSTKSSRRSDAFIGYLVPIFFTFLAAYQEVHDHHIDKYVIGALLVFGLGALGWRIDSLFERYIDAKAGIREAESSEAESKTE